MIGRALIPIAAVFVQAGGAVAGGWAVFEARCLAPMEHFMPGVVDGLAPYEPSDGDRDGDGAEAQAGLPTKSFRTPLEGTVLHLSSGPVCTVSVSNAGQAEGDAALAWRDAALQSGRYVETADGTLESNLWREPRLPVRLIIDRPGGRAVFIALETDLES